MIVDAVSEKKGQNITVIDLRDITTAPCDFFVICSASSKIKINAIADNIERIMLNKINQSIWNQEGRDSNWRLIDFGNIVIHIFKSEIREYYNLEELWGDGKIEKIKLT